MPPPGGGVAVTVSATGVVCEPEMAVPVTVMVELPVAALGVAVTLMVELCPADTEVGLNTTVTPLGCPVAVERLVCALPEVTAVLMVLEPEEPCPVPVMVLSPVAAPALPVTLMVELCPADTEAGLNTTVTPLGCPVAVRVMVWALPEVTAVLMVLEPEEPCWMERLAGLAEIEKSFGSGVTVSATG